MDVQFAREVPAFSSAAAMAAAAMQCTLVLNANVNSTTLTRTLDGLALQRNPHNYTVLRVVELDIHCDAKEDARRGHQPRRHSGGADRYVIADDRESQPVILKDLEEVSH